jgi:hypothetical protein
MGKRSSVLPVKVKTDHIPNQMAACMINGVDFFMAQSSLHFSCLEMA